MQAVKNINATSWLLGVAMAFAVGCAGATDIPGDALIEAEPLPWVAEDIWGALPADCESQLDQAVSFGIAFGAPELIVAIDDRGNAFCLDTYPAVESELLDLGSELNDPLWLGYIATLQETEALIPTSNTAVTREVIAPNVLDGVLEKVAGDPQPQPSRPIEPIPLPESDADSNNNNESDGAGYDQMDDF